MGVAEIIVSASWVKIKEDFCIISLDFWAYIIYSICTPESEVIRVSPRTGRPPKGKESRTEKINIRVSKTEAQTIQDCADQLQASRTDAIMQGIHLLKAELEKE